MFNTPTINWKPLADPKAIVQGDTYRFTVLTNRLIRMEWSADGVFEDRPTRMVACREFPVPEFQVIDEDDSLQIITDALHLYYDKKRFSFGGLSIALKGMIKHKCAKWHFHMPLITIHNQTTNLRGTCCTLDNADGAYELEDGLLNRHGFEVVEDKDTLVLNEKGWYEPRPEKDCEDLYFFGYLLDHKACIQDFYKLSGATPMLPRYALGNWWSRYYPYSEETYKELMEQFAQKKIPLSVSVLDMDWHITQPDPKYGNGWTGYTWNPKLFPDPPRMLSWLHDHGLKVTMNLHPCDGIRAFEACYEEAAKAMGIDPATEETVQFDAADPKHMKMYLEKVLHPLEEQGVDFWWIDWQQHGGTSQEKVDPLWMLNHYLYEDNARKGTYPLTLSRYAGKGSHRYPLGFSGDTVMSWKSLDFQPYFTNCASNVGYGWWSHDIGGHTRGIWDDELQIRWLQYGVFSPINRLHSTKDTFLLKEPWNFPIGTELIMTDYLRLRHKLIPYLYTMNYRNHAQGLPLICPMYYDHPLELINDKDFVNQYTFGSELMVCPITSKMDPEAQTGKAHAWIPEGTWFDLFTHRRYCGKKVLDLYRTIEQYPVLAKAGAIVPLDVEATQNGAPLPAHMHLKAFCGADGSFTLYEDDEKLYHTKRAFTKYSLAWGKEACLTIYPVDGDADILPETRIYTLELVGLNEPRKVTVLLNGREVEVPFAWQKGSLKVTVDAVKPCDEVKLLVNTDGDLYQENWAQTIENRLPRYQMENVPKQKILAALRGATDPMSLLGSLASLVENPYILGEFAEILTAAK